MELQALVGGLEPQPFIEIHRIGKGPLDDARSSEDGELGCPEYMPKIVLHPLSPRTAPRYS